MGRRVSAAACFCCTGTSAHGVAYAQADARPSSAENHSGACSVAARACSRRGAAAGAVRWRRGRRDAPRVLYDAVALQGVHQAGVVAAMAAPRHGVAVPGRAERGQAQVEAQEAARASRGDAHRQRRRHAAARARERCETRFAGHTAHARLEGGRV